MHLPFKQFEGAKSRRCIGITSGNLLCFLLRLRTNDVDSVFSIGGWSGKQNFPRMMLLLHPDQVLIKINRPLVSRLRWPAQN
jgi:hypothetical protein